MEIKIRNKNEINELLKGNDEEIDNILENLINSVEKKEKIMPIVEKKIENNKKIEIKENISISNSLINKSEYDKLLDETLNKFENKLYDKWGSTSKFDECNKIENYINDYLKKFKSNTKEIINNNLAESFEDITIPILEDYFTKLYEKVINLIEKGFLYYNNMINKHYITRDETKTRFNGIINDFETELSQIVNSLNVKTEENFNKKNEKNNSILINKLNEILYNQNYIFKEINNLNSKVDELDNSYIKKR